MKKSVQKVKGEKKDAKFGNKKENPEEGGEITYQKLMEQMAQVESKKRLAKETGPAEKRAGEA